MKPTEERALRIDSTLLKVTTGFLAFEVATIERVVALDKERRIGGELWQLIIISSSAAVTALGILVVLLWATNADAWLPKTARYGTAVCLLVSIVAYSLFIRQFVQQWYAR
jgi:hypothetical protein